jgi:UDP-N-acetylmuramoyl-L-alanyl-D-glutamate--2,6-diaminopimelate ligase
MTERAPRLRAAVPISAVSERLRARHLLRGSDASDAVVSGITDDSREVQPGDLFCAWAGTAIDAHAFVPAAARAGAAAAIVERPVAEAAIPQLVVTDGRRGAAAAAALLYGDPGTSMVLVAVTGTNGKTTTVWLTRHLLGLTERVASMGTLGTLRHDGSPYFPGESLTTPGPVELVRTLAALREDGVRTVVMEVSSHALDQDRVYGLEFGAAAFTNLSRDHLDYHASLEAYAAAKRKLVRYLAADGVAVVNADDATWNGLAAEAPRSLTFSMGDAPADVTAREVTLSGAGAAFMLRLPAGSAPVRMPLVGAFNVENALAAAAIAAALGRGVDEVSAGLAGAPQVPGRLERIADQPCPVFRDYAHTPDALERVIEALKPLIDGRLILVFGAGGDRDRGKRPLMGAVAERWADVAIVTSDNPRTEDPAAIIAEIEAGMPAGRHLRVVDRREAIATALEQAGPGDAVLLAGKGHETHQTVGDRRLPFDERLVVADLVRRMPNEVDA